MLRRFGAVEQETVFALAEDDSGFFDGRPGEMRERGRAMEGGLPSAASVVLTAINRRQAVRLGEKPCLPLSCPASGIRRASRAR